MSVRHSLLAILDQGPCYGYQLRSEFGRRTGSPAPLNVGQVYNTLERLRRDGLVADGGTDEHGHVYWQITDAGRATVREWLDSPVASAPVRDELVMKLALAASLPGADVDRMLSAQRHATRRRLSAVREERAAMSDLVRALALDAQELAAEAELRWLDRVAERLREHPTSAFTLELSTDKPRRGRPARVEASLV